MFFIFAYLILFLEAIPRGSMAWWLRTQALALSEMEFWLGQVTGGMALGQLLMLSLCLFLHL